MSQITKRVRIAALKEKVWETLSDFGGVYKWAPNVLHSRCTTEATEGVGAERHCDIEGFGAVGERVTEWEEGRSIGITFTQAPGPIKTLNGRASLRDVGGDTVVAFTLNYQMKFGPVGALMDWLMVRRKMSGTAARSLAGLKHYVETGGVVSADVKLPEFALATVA